MLIDCGCVLCDAGDGPVCPACAAALPADPPEVDVPGLVACRVRYALDERVLQLVASLKYRGERRVARWLAGQLVPLVPLAADEICWVPATATDRRRRGFDQSEEIARALGSLTGLRARRRLRRSSLDHNQTGLARPERLAGPTLEAVGSADFTVVVDDVTTTGASLGSAANALHEAGARRIVGLVAAATPRRSAPARSFRERV